ncbi:hypothetical protein ZWY2020_026130 [Hordeum vulgare]|uniref:Uncharacterized protein n=1 Tax=Hordeum vulgare subsp. vulgare TaxID=112509 RepID=M0WXU1_HORVV|nr:hypothetical protein ZWY2020_026124 [Hordeum vulgare]KAI5001480.1 hypothetical protein ZWY2020_026130 [Hordeum vulgare]
MSHTCMLYFQAHQNHAKFQDNHASIRKEEASVGAKHVQAHKKQVKFQDNHANDIKIDDVSKDVDTVASDFINRKYTSWALQKSTTMYPA